MTDEEMREAWRWTKKNCLILIDAWYVTWWEVTPHLEGSQIEDRVNWIREMEERWGDDN